MSRRKVRESFKKIGHWFRKHWKAIAIVGAVIGVSLIPGVGPKIGQALTKIPIGTALKVAAIGGAGYVGYKGTKKVGHEIGDHKKSLLVGTGLIGGLILYRKFK